MIHGVSSCSCSPFVIDDAWYPPVLVDFLQKELSPPNTNTNTNTQWEQHMNPCTPHVSSSHHGTLLQYANTVMIYRPTAYSTPMSVWSVSVSAVLVSLVLVQYLYLNACLLKVSLPWCVHVNILHVFPCSIYILYNIYVHHWYCHSVSVNAPVPVLYLYIPILILD